MIKTTLQELCNISEKYAYDLIAKAMEIKRLNKGSKRIRELESSALVINNLTKVIRSFNTLEAGEIVGDDNAANECDHPQWSIDDNDNEVCDTCGLVL